ncbi:unnamed protein product [Symbiodinium natans]|uniref:Methyltransferase domain-containing protein n=1 Tax=Symbiodinium natans TaxID=878477 RepID=A0A812JHL2_9DINO|nr:unnamed protein product [Symbiodinium natans]
MAGTAEREPDAGYQSNIANESNESILLDQLRLRNQRAWMAVTNSQGMLMPKSLLKLCMKQAVPTENQNAEHLLRGLLEAELKRSDTPGECKEVDTESLRKEFLRLCQQFAPEKECLAYEEWLRWDGLDATISAEGARSLWLRLVGPGKSASEEDFLRLARVMRQECGLATTIQSFLRGNAGRRRARHEAREASDSLENTCLENAAKLAPYNPTPDCAIKQALDALGVQSGDTLYDLGCGDGRMLLAAARRGARAVGVEYDSRFAQKASEAIREAGLESLAEVICGDALKTNLSDATKIFVYLVPDGLRMMSVALSDASRRGVPIASYLFALPGWSPSAVLTSDTRSIECKVWMYQDFTASPMVESSRDKTEEEKPALFLRGLYIAKVVMSQKVSEHDGCETFCVAGIACLVKTS